MATYLKGWEGARIAYGDHAGEYTPIACITSRSESNATKTSEKVNVCTEGKVITKATGVDMTVSISGEVVTLDSLEDLRSMQDTLEEQDFRIYRGSGTSSPIYFSGVITNLAADYPTGEGEDATFTMDITLTKDYTDDDPYI